MRGLLLMVLVLSFASCQKARVNKADRVLTTHSWEITQLVVGGENITAKGFEEYCFTFQREQSVLHAKIASVQTDVKGNWILSINDENKANLYLKVENPLDELNANWQIKSVSNKSIVLEAHNSNRLVFGAKD